MVSPQPQKAVEFLPSGRIAGFLHSLAVLREEEVAFVMRQLGQDALRIEGILMLPYWLGLMEPASAAKTADGGFGVACRPDLQ